MPSGNRYVHVEYRDRFKKNAEGKSAKVSRTQIFENSAGDKLALELDVKTGQPKGDLVHTDE